VGPKSPCTRTSKVGEIVDCATCGAELEVIGVDPVELDSAPELEEDWGE